MGGLPLDSTGSAIDGVAIIFGVVGFILIVYCVIIFAIAFLSPHIPKDDAVSIHVPTYIL